MHGAWDMGHGAWGMGHGARDWRLDQRLGVAEALEGDRNWKKVCRGQAH